MKKLLLLWALGFTFFGYAQQKELTLDYYLPDGITYDPGIPTPKEVIGHEVGEWHVTHDKLLHYMHTLAQASPRVTIENRGSTFEGRPIILLTISSPNNHAKLTEIQAQHMALTEAGADNLDVASMPIVVYQGFSIHGNEPSGSNAALAAAYHLAAAQGPAIDKLLNEAVILFDPSFNPDGLQRFAYWANIHKSQNINPDPNDREYSEVWPGGRTNHYWFDMNRDWLPVQLPESRARIKTFHNWYPNILTDHHEMGTNASFFFQPGIPSRTHPLTPQKNQDLTGAIAQFHAKAFNKIGSLYYSEESFDDFYYGKGSTFPDINGAIGILFEQASSRGHAQESENGLLTFPFTIRNQFTAALSTLDAAVAMRVELLEYQRGFYSNARSEAAKGGALVFGDDKDAARVYHLAEILERHKIKVFELKQDLSIDGKEYKKGYAYVVPKNQKQHRLINAMFEKRTQFQDSLFYDISAWTFPLAFNLNTANTSMANAAAEVTPKLPQGQVNGRSDYAYLIEWHGYYTPKATYQLLDAGLRVKAGMKPFGIGGKEYDYGTLMIPVQNQKLSPSEIHAKLQAIAEENHLKIDAVQTGLTTGIDLGSRQFRALNKPKVALLVGSGVTSYDAGEIWHLFDTRYDIPITKLDTRNFGRMDLSKYTDLIIPNNWGSALSKNDAEKIKAWVEAGGTLIAYKNSGRWLKSNELLKLKFKTRKDSAQNISFEQKGDYRGAQVIGGAIFESRLDRSHPIAFGYRNNTLPLFRNSTLFLEPDGNSYNNPIRYTESPLLSGYISEENLKDLSGSSALVVKNKGRGTIIYFTDNTNFRAFWYGTNKLLMNAIYFGDEM
mgnify:CR=1 FL=1